MNNFARRLVLTPRQMKKTTQEWPIGGLGVCCNLVPRAFTLAWGQDKGPGNEVGYQLLLPPLLVKPVFSTFQSLDSDPCFTFQISLNPLVWLQSQILLLFDYTGFSSEN